MGERPHFSGTIDDCRKTKASKYTDETAEILARALNAQLEENAKLKEELEQLKARIRALLA